MRQLGVPVAHHEVGHVEHAGEDHGERGAAPDHEDRLVAQHGRHRVAQVAAEEPITEVESWKKIA